MRKIETCIYHPLRPVSKHCKECGVGLCKYCGYSNGQDVFCKEHERKSTRGVYHFSKLASKIPLDIII